MKVWNILRRAVRRAFQGLCAGWGGLEARTADSGGQSQGLHPASRVSRSPGGNARQRRTARRAEMRREKLAAL
jgi:hypothetical protein